ncbi:MAG: hypothetical protein JWM57_2615, partial [Phycisphaerales bacterium]|nr:hypothetical protein [Phycisphaerales bacterium]
TITLENGQVKTLTPHDVKSIELEGNRARPDKAAAGLKSLQRSVEFSDDVAKIIQRYRVFIEQTKDPVVVKQAKADLSVWQDRQDRHLVKVGRQWIAADQRDELQKQWRHNAEQARLLMKDSRDREAAKLIDETIDQDPQNAAALYLRGVLADKRQDVPEAKKAYLAVQQVLPQHAPTLLNLALVLAKQKQWPAASVALEQSLQAAPVTQALLDTTAEFINLSPPESRRGAAAQKLFRAFLDQDARLQKIMAEKHLYRWGSTWINQADHERLQQKNDEGQQKITAIQNEFDAAQQQLAKIDMQVAADQRTMREIEQRSYVSMADGSIIRTPFPRQYYTLQSDIVELKAQRKESEDKLEPLRAQARDTQQALPAPTYTGVLISINEDGVPLPALPGDTAAPATAPAEPSTQPSTVIRIGPPDDLKSVPKN